MQMNFHRRLPIPRTVRKVSVSIFSANPSPIRVLAGKRPKDLFLTLQKNYKAKTATKHKMFRCGFSRLARGYFVYFDGEAPVFACILGALILGEDIWKIQYLVAFMLIGRGIWISNLEKDKISNKQQ